MTTAGNPYSPPKAQVRDASDARPLGERPQQIAFAIALSSISLLIGVVSGAVPYSAEPVQRAVETGIWALVIAAGIMINLAVWRGRNWARVVYAVLTVLALLGIPLELSARPAAALALDIVSLVLAVVVLYLLFTGPGSVWFKDTREQRL